MKDKQTDPIQTPKPEARENNEAGSKKRDFETDWLPCVDGILRSIGYKHNELDKVSWKQLYDENYSPFAAVSISEFGGELTWKVYQKLRGVLVLLNSSPNDAVSDTTGAEQTGGSLSQNLLKSNKLGDVANLLKDFHQELEKEVVKRSDNLKQEIRNWSQGQHVGLPKSTKEVGANIDGFIDGANWSYTYLLPIIEKLQQENNTLKQKA